MRYEIQDAHRHSPRVARKRQARMQRIVAGALAIARAEGSEALTLQRVADALGVTPASLYRYFASKDALVAELQRSVIAWLARATRGCIDDAHSRIAAEGSLARHEAALVPVVVTAFAFERFARTAPVEFGLLSMHLSTPEYGLSEREAARVFESAWQSLGDLAGHLDEAATAGALAPGSAAERAVTLWAGLQGLVQTRKLLRSARDRIDPTALVCSLVPTLLLGWGGAPERVAAAVGFVREHDLAAPAGSADDLLTPQPEEDAA